MKKTKKIVALVLAAVMLVCTTVAATVAYLTSTTEVVENTFTVGDVKITLDEADVDNDDNSDDNVEDNSQIRDLANKYNVFPGGTYPKDPTVHVDIESEDCYVFVKVENGFATFEQASVEGGYQNIADQIVANGWVLVEGEGDTSIYIYNRVVEADEDLVVFEEFAVRTDNVDNDTDFTGVEINVTAYAIQADGFDATKDADIATMMAALEL